MSRDEIYALLLWCCLYNEIEYNHDKETVFSKQIWTSLKCCLQVQEIRDI